MLTGQKTFPLAKRLLAGTVTTEQLGAALNSTLGLAAFKALIEGDNALALVNDTNAVPILRWVPLAANEIRNHRGVNDYIAASQARAQAIADGEENLKALLWPVIVKHWPSFDTTGATLIENGGFESASSNSTGPTGNTWQYPAGWTLTQVNSSSGNSFYLDNTWATEGTYSFRMYCAYSSGFTGSYHITITKDLDLTGVDKVLFDLKTGVDHGTGGGTFKAYIGTTEAYANTTPNQTLSDVELDVTAYTGTQTLKFECAVSGAVLKYTDVLLDNVRTATNGPLTFDGTSLAGWTMGGEGTMVATGGYFQASSYGSGGSWHGPSATYDVGENVGDFQLDFDMVFNSTSSASLMGSIGMDLYDATDVKVAGFGHGDAWAGSVNGQQSMVQGGTTLYDSGVVGGYANHTATITIKRVGSTWSLLRNGAQVASTTGVTTAIRKLTLYFWQHSSYGAATQKVTNIHFEKL